MRGEADERQVLKQLCRYITRPALSGERMRCNAAGQMVLRLQTFGRGGATHLVTSPMEFVQRLAAPVPRPRVRLSGCYMSTNSRQRM